MRNPSVGFEYKIASEGILTNKATYKTPGHPRSNQNKTQVESVQLGKTLELSNHISGQ